MAKVVASPMSNGAVDRAGRVLRAHALGEVVAPEVLEDSWGVLERYRAQWRAPPIFPLQAVLRALRGASGVARRSDVSGRLKRAERIVNKLTREENGGRAIEVQIRTALQHFWARRVEAYEVEAGVPLKNGVGPAGVLAAFAMEAEELATLDLRGDVPEVVLDQVLPHLPPEC